MIQLNLIDQVISETLKKNQKKISNNDTNNISHEYFNSSDSEKYEETSNKKHSTIIRLLNKFCHKIMHIVMPVSKMFNKAFNNVENNYVLIKGSLSRNLDYTNPLNKFLHTSLYHLQWYKMSNFVIENSTMNTGIHQIKLYHVSNPNINITNTIKK